jgi:urease accessory protein
MNDRERRMIRATAVIPAASWSHVATDAVVLDFDARHRRRMLMTGEGGLEFLLDLPEAVVLRDGDGLVLDDGRIVAVKAALEPLAEIGAPDPHTLLRLAWHLGNRHLPASIETGRILIRRDHVIEEMVAGLGGTVKLISAPFDPEGGAYAHGHVSVESHAHSHSHSRGHGHAHAQSHSHSHSHDHHHDDGHGHDHRHD